MRFDKVIYLISVSYSDNEVGDSIATPIKRQVFAQEKSVKQSEFYQAAVTGLKPELTFVLWAHEYNDETQLEYQGVTYSILRTFKPNAKEIELVCTGLVKRGD